MKAWQRVLLMRQATTFLARRSEMQETDSDSAAINGAMLLNQLDTNSSMRSIVSDINGWRVRGALPP